VRILHVLHQYFPDHVGGTEHYARSLAQEQQREGHEVAIFFRQGGEGRTLENERVGGIQIYRATHGPFTPVRRFSSTLGDGYLAHSLIQVVSEVRPDLIHIHHLMGLPVNVVGELKRSIPLVVTLHDYWWVCANAQLITDYDGQVCEGPRWWLNCARCGLAKTRLGATGPVSPFVMPVFGWRAGLLRRLMPRVTAWIAPTGFVASWHAAHGFDERRMHVVSHGIELPAADVAERAWDERRQAAVHFAYVGGLSPQKGVHILVEAFNRLPKTARLTIAGDEDAFPDYVDDLRIQAAHRGIGFAGRLDRDEVWQLLSDADVLVVPSLWYETASLAVQEAFAMRTPVIAADHGALAERVVHEKDGLLVPRGDVTELYAAMLRTMYEPDLLPRLQDGIRPQAGIAEHTRQVDEVYKQAAGHLGHAYSQPTPGPQGQGSERLSDASASTAVEETTDSPDSLR
jgi:glycosyltransferase involved in cell wall biosynthesis